MTATARWAFVLAVGATATALSLSILAGWQRGGALSERVVWVAIGVVLVLSAHTLPALVRTAPLAIRGVACVLWVACMATACYGHSLFFLLAQRHAGELRAAAESVVPVATSTRNLTVVMAERATVIAQLATARARYCAGNCVTLEARRVTLAAKRDALDAEADDIRRRHAEDDRVASQRDALLADPVTSRLAVLLGVTVARVDLLSDLTFAVVLEGVACLLWTIALRPSPTLVPASRVTPTAVTAVIAVTPSHAAATVSCETTTGGHGSAGGSHALSDDPVTLLPDAGAVDDEVTRLAQEIAAGRIRPTVAGIRLHLGCSQARATTLRRQLSERNLTA